MRGEDPVRDVLGPQRSGAPTPWSFGGPSRLCESGPVPTSTPLLLTFSPCLVEFEVPVVPCLRCMFADVGIDRGLRDFVGGPGGRGLGFLQSLGRWDRSLEGSGGYVSLRSPTTARGTPPRRVENDRKDKYEGRTPLLRPPERSHPESRRGTGPEVEESGIPRPRRSHEPFLSP